MSRLLNRPERVGLLPPHCRERPSWDEVVTDLGYEHLERHGLRHTD